MKDRRMEERENVKRQKEKMEPERKATEKLGGNSSE